MPRRSPDHHRTIRWRRHFAGGHEPETSDTAGRDQREEATPSNETPGPCHEPDRRQLSRRTIRSSRGRRRRSAPASAQGGSRASGDRLAVDRAWTSPAAIAAERGARRLARSY